MSLVDETHPCPGKPDPHPTHATLDEHGCEDCGAADVEGEIDMPCPAARCPACGGLLGLRPVCAHPDHALTIGDDR
jgi:hypothetical protein